MSYLTEVEVVTDAVSLPVTLDEAKQWIKMEYGEDTDEDALVTSLISTATTMVEGATNLSLGEKTLKAHYANFESRIELPYGPINSITSVTRTYMGVETLLATTDYSTHGGKFKTLVVNQVFKISDVHDYGLIVEYEAGYTEAPENAKKAIKMEVARMYFHRGDEITPRISNEARKILLSISRNL